MTSNHEINLYRERIGQLKQEVSEKDREITYLKMSRNTSAVAAGKIIRDLRQELEEWQRAAHELAARRTEPSV